MKKHMMRLLFLGMIVSLVARYAHAQERPDIADFNLGLGIVISPDYNRTLEDLYDDYDMTGGYGWLNVNMGVRFNIGHHFSLTPGADLLVNYVGGAVSFANAIVLPQVGARVCFKRAPSLYLAGQVHYILPYTGSERYDLDVDTGIGGGGMVGYDFGGGSNLEIGYLYVPVTISTSPVRAFDRDFGGFLLRFKYAF